MESALALHNILMESAIELHNTLMEISHANLSLSLAPTNQYPRLSEFIGSPYFQSQNLFKFMVGVLAILSLVSKLSRHHAYRIVRECKDSYICAQYVEIQYVHKIVRK